MKLNIIKYLILISYIILKKEVGTAILDFSNIEKRFPVQTVFLRNNKEIALGK